MECPNCHNANKHGDYEGPTCEVCHGTGSVPLPEVEVDPWPQYRHKKRGTTYTVMGRATMQAEGPLDNVKVVIYQSNVDGSMWVRPLTEFEDGRFERVTS